MLIVFADNAKENLNREEREMLFSAVRKKYDDDDVATRSSLQNLFSGICKENCTYILARRNQLAANGMCQKIKGVLDEL